MRSEEQGTRNLELAHRLMGLVLDAPARLRSLAGRPLVFMPTGDPELASANDAMAERLRARGEEVTYVLVMPEEQVGSAHGGSEWGGGSSVGVSKAVRIGGDQPEPSGGVEVRGVGSGQPIGPGRPIRLSTGEEVEGEWGAAGDERAGIRW
jgi:hypothetical protein